jgi:hypothetical protein
MLKEVVMSSVPNGGGDLYIGNGSTAYYWVTHNSGGWPGNGVVEAQALNTGAALESTLDSVDLNANGQYYFNYHIRNYGPNNTYFNVQFALV